MNLMSDREKRALDVIGNCIQIAFLFLAVAAFVLCIVAVTGCGDLPTLPNRLHDIHPAVYVDIPLGQIKYEANR